MDPGALNCMASALEKIGVLPEGKEVFELANRTATRTLKRMSAKPLKSYLPIHSRELGARVRLPKR